MVRIVASRRVITFFRIAILVFLSGSVVSRYLRAETSLRETDAISVDRPLSAGDFPLFAGGKVAAIYIAPEEKSPVRMAAKAFAADLARVTGVVPLFFDESTQIHSKNIVLVGSIGHSRWLDRLQAQKQIDVSAVTGKWEAAVVTVVNHPFPGVENALVIAGSDPRGAAYALFELSRQIGVSPWSWWADVPVRRHTRVGVTRNTYIMPSPSVRYRGIFLNDEDWGLRPWAAKKMDTGLKNIGPRTYVRVFELLLRLHANTLWPAMHPGTLPFNAIGENAVLADRWGIVMGSSHSEALLRNNVGEWSEKLDGPWNYQVNSAAITRYWDERLKTNGRFENIYTVGMRGVHDSGLEATGSPEMKARLLESIISEQQRLFVKDVNPDLEKIPEVLWIYKEVLGLYRAGMKIPENVTLGWTDDNYGYIRELPNQAEQRRSGGSALYYHVSYWGEPHDYLWLCTTPPALMREELTKAWEHGVRQMWILNVGDLKPAEMDIEYFLRMAWDEPAMAEIDQHDFLVEWNREQFPEEYAGAIANLMEEYYRLNVIRKPEFMGFNNNNEPIRRTAFNPLAWSDQNRQRLHDWQKLRTEAKKVEDRLPQKYRDAYFELTGYPIEAAAAQNAKFLWNDRSYLDSAQGHVISMRSDADNARAAYDEIQNLTARYNSLAGGKWNGIMSSHPRDLNVFGMPVTADRSAVPSPLPMEWATPRFNEPAMPKRNGAGSVFAEENRTISINAVHFSAANDANGNRWHLRPELGLPGGSVFFGELGRMTETPWGKAGTPNANQAVAASPWIEYEFTTHTADHATLSLYFLPTFPIDSDHRLRYAVALDGAAPIVLDAMGAEEHRKGITAWSSNVLSNAAVQTLDIGNLRPGRHSLRLIYCDPDVILEHILITFPGAPPAYPFPPETRGEYSPDHGNVTRRGRP